MDEVCGRWRKLAITETEEEEIGIGDDLVAEGKSLLRKGLVGKLLTRRIYNKKLFKSTITNLWKVEGGFEIKEVGADVFFFIFEDPREIERVLSLEPWTFNRSLLVLKEFEGLTVNDTEDLRYTRFWVQVHNVPDVGMTDKIGRVIGDGIGIALDVDADSDGRCVGPFMRVRVLIDIAKPLRRGAPIRLGSSGDRKWVDFKYERVPDFCFICGIIGHSDQECKHQERESIRAASSLPYGKWLRGDPPSKRIRPAQEMLPLNSAGMNNLPCATIEERALTQSEEFSKKRDDLPFPSQSDNNLAPGQISSGKTPVFENKDDTPENTELEKAKNRGSSGVSYTNCSPKAIKALSMSPSKILFHAGTQSPQSSRTIRNWKSEARHKGSSEDGSGTPKSLTPVKRKILNNSESTSDGHKRRESSNSFSQTAITAEVALQPRRAQ